jgi:sortase A
MRDRRSVDDLTVEELEEILRIKKRQAHQARLDRFERMGRRRGDLPLPGDGRTVTDAGDGPDPIAFESFVYENGAPRRNLRDRLLLVVEIAAVMGLIGILAFTAITLRNLNEASTEAQQAQIADLPTPTATPILSAVVLPGGHTPPTDPGGAQPNYNEVPASLRPIVQQQFAGPVIVPTPGPSSAIRLRVPAIGVDAPIVQGDGWEQLKKGVGQHIPSADPGQAGNVVLSAHDDVYGQIFRYLDRLHVGDKVIVSTQTQDYTYEVVNWRVVPPTTLDVMDSNPNESIVTLISCYPYLVNSDRIVVVARLTE